MNFIKRSARQSRGAVKSGEMGYLTTTSSIIKHASLSMVIRRADGTVEDHGIVAQTTFVPPSLFDKIVMWGKSLCPKF